MLSGHSVGTYPEKNELTRNSSGDTRSQWSELTEPLWTDPGLEKVDLVCASYSPLEKKKSAGRE